MPVEQVHLHEVGALDSIIDIVGAVFALEWFGADRIVCSPLNVGGGMVHSAHGLFPVPAPATVKLLGDAPIYSGAVQKELVTPTGALIATSYASSFGPIPAMSVERVGYGAGDRDDPVTPNVLRVLIGRETGIGEAERVTVIECEIDDMNPQIFGVAMDRLYAAGALEVFYVPVQMKKNRPGTLLTVVAPPELRRADGRRHLPRDDDDRAAAPRRGSRVSGAGDRRVETPIGTVRFKVASRDGRVLNATPEFEDCAAWPPPTICRSRTCRRSPCRKALTGPWEPFLPDDRDRLRQQPAAPRDGVREDRRRRHRALQAAVRLRHAVPDGQRRALAERVQEGDRGRGSIRWRTATRWSRSSATPGGGSTSRSTISSARPSRGTRPA